MLWNYLVVLGEEKNVQSDEENQDTIKSYLADEYDKAAALRLQMFLNMDLPSQFIPSLADHTQEEKFEKFLPELLQILHLDQLKVNGWCLESKL